MNRIVPALTALTMALTLGAANAQQPGTPNTQQPGTPGTQPYSPSVVNPYLNLLNRGNPAINYYGIVRPQIQQGQQLQMLQFGLNRTAAEATAAETAATTPGAPAATGHTVGFMTYTRYFNTVSARGR